MSWDTPHDNGTVRLNMEIGWMSSANAFLQNLGLRNTSWVKIDWGDGGDNESVTIRTTGIESGSSITEMGVWDGSIWTPGVKHNYDNGTYEVTWYSCCRIDDIKNIPDDTSWRGETKVTIGGIHAGNVSPVSAVPPIVQVQDNTKFIYQVSAADANTGDNLHFRWGTYQEFVDNLSNSTFSKPTGMTLSSDGVVEWNVLDNNSAISTVKDDVWLAFIIVEDNSSSGDNKSHIPIDFFFKLADPSNDPPVFTEFPSGTQTVSVDTTKTFTIKSKDDRGVAPTISVLNPPPLINSIWSTTSSSSADNITTFTITFEPDSSMLSSSGLKSYRKGRYVVC
jgi:hypothetical protein